jgi:hypothetical protein
MSTYKRTAVVVMAGLVISGVSARGWSADNKNTALTTSTAATVGGGDQSLLGMLAPVLTEPARHQPEKSCDKGQIYSQHDVVGDPEACMMGRINTRGGVSISGPGTL